MLSEVREADRPVEYHERRGRVASRVDIDYDAFELGVSNDWCKLLSNDPTPLYTHLVRDAHAHGRHEKTGSVAKKDLPYEEEGSS